MVSFLPDEFKCVRNWWSREINFSRGVLGSTYRTSLLTIIPVTENSDFVGEVTNPSLEVCPSKTKSWVLLGPRHSCPWGSSVSVWVVTHPGQLYCASGETMDAVRSVPYIAHVQAGDIYFIT